MYLFRASLYFSTNFKNLKLKYSLKRKTCKFGDKCGWGRAVFAQRLWSVVCFGVNNLRVNSEKRKVGDKCGWDKAVFAQKFGVKKRIG